MHGNLREDQ